MRKLIERALSVFEVDAERLRAARPDIILTQHQCEACPVTERDLTEALAKWTGTAPRIVALAPETLSPGWDTFGVVGETRSEERRGGNVCGRTCRYGWA